MRYKYYKFLVRSKQRALAKRTSQIRCQYPNEKWY